MSEFKNIKKFILGGQTKKTREWNKKHLGITSAILWGDTGERWLPLLYFKKPKWLTEEEYQKIIESLMISIDNDIT
jgi:hypothetical protein